jgi:hypothetical protein
MSPKKRKMEKHVKNRCSSINNCRQLKKLEDRGGGGSLFSEDSGGSGVEKNEQEEALKVYQVGTSKTVVCETYWLFTFQ